MYIAVLMIVIVLFSVINSYHDIRDMKVYDYPLWFACYSAIICHMIFNRQNLWIYILSGMISGMFYYCIRLISKKNLGIGDVYFAFFQGFCLHVKYLPICFIIEVVITLIVMNKKIGRESFPFVPFMAVGLFITYVLELFIGV